MNIERANLYFILGAFIKLLNERKQKKQHACPEINMVHGNIQIKQILLIFNFTPFPNSFLFKYLLFYFFGYLYKIFLQKPKFKNKFLEKS